MNREQGVIAAIEALEREPWWTAYESASARGFAQTDGHSVLLQLRPPTLTREGLYAFVSSPSGLPQAVLFGPRKWLRRLMLFGAPGDAYLLSDVSAWEIATIPWKYARRFRNG